MDTHTTMDTHMIMGIRMVILTDTPMMTLMVKIRLEIINLHAGLMHWILVAAMINPLEPGVVVSACFQVA